MTTVLMGVLVSSQGPMAVPREILTVRPTETAEVLVNPGMGFMTFQRFNGDDLNAGPGWTEGLPIEYQTFDGDLANQDYPDTSLAYFRINWRFVEPEKGKYNWDMLDRALETAAGRGQTLLLRVSPYEDGTDKDVPAWYRKLVGEERALPLPKWRVDPENPFYLKHFGGLIRALGSRYDGHPQLESVDIALVGFWGEGEGSHLLRDRTRISLTNAYLESFTKTPLIFQPLNGDAPNPAVLVRGLPIAAEWPDGTNNGTGPHMRHLGWRLDCLGDMGFWRESRGNWNHMFNVYPRDIIRSGMRRAWKKGPVTLEICGTFRRWRNTEGYTEAVVRFIFEQALKWHISSFNAKSSPIPKEWQPLVDDWLRKMGYRFVLREFTFPSEVRPSGKLDFTSWWENRGVAPCYRDFPLAIRLVHPDRTLILLTDADIRKWLPGDSLFDDAVFLPADLPEGEYHLQLGIVDPRTSEPIIKLAIAGMSSDGWYPMGAIQVRKKGQ